MTDEPNTVPRDLGWGLGVLFRAYLQAGNDVFGDLPGGPRAYQLLLLAERDQASNQRELARRLGIDRTVMTYLLDDLVEAGLVERHVDPADRRARRIAVTARGRRLLPELDQRLDLIEQRVLTGLTDADAVRFRALLRNAASELDRIEHIEDLHDIPEQMAPHRRHPT